MPTLTTEIITAAILGFEEQKRRRLARDAGQGLIKPQEVGRVVTGRGRHEQDLGAGLRGQLEHVTRQGREGELLAAAGDDPSRHPPEAS